ncbi:MAG: DUF167 family protein [Thermodesulfobacteriota bacterium]
MPFLKNGKGESELFLAVYLQPRAARNRIVGPHGAELKVAVTAPPVEGKANKALISFMAKALGVAKGQISLIRGQQSRHKQLLLTGISGDQARRQIAALTA